MAELVIDAAERRKADELLRFTKNFFADLSVEARMYFAMEMVRHLKPELEELKRRAAHGNQPTAASDSPPNQARV